MSARDLSHGAQGRWLFRGLELELRRRECVVILGASGTGKSTLIGLLGGLVEPHKGSIVSNGVLYIVFQEVGLFEFDALTVRENLELAGASAPRDLLEAVGLGPELLDARPGSLSGGQRRRVAIARALASSPAGILYDEPTSGLDTRSAGLVAGLIRRSTLECGIASLVVTHDLEVAALLGDRILRLEPGSGTLKSLRVQHIDDPARSLEALRTALEADDPAPATRPGAPPPPDRASGTPALLSPFEAIGAAVMLLPWAPFVAREGAIRRRLVAIAPGAITLSTVGCAAIGLVIALQSAAGLGRFEAAHLMPEVAATSMVRAVLPLLVGLLLAGRIGASVAAEVGSYSLSGQITALRVLGKRPEPYLAAPLLWAAAITLPLATLAGLLAGSAGLAFGATRLLGLKWSLVAAGLQHAVHERDLALALLKSTLFGIAIAVAAYRHGMAPKTDAADLGRGATRGVVEGSIAVVLLDCLITELTRAW